jgi:CheY-like chemotaxis protein
MVKRSKSGVHRLVGTRVLIVDADTDSSDLYAIWLRSAGHRVSIASDAARAVILAPMLRPTVAVIEIGLPGVDGVELVRMLRQFPELEHCRYLAITAFADERLRGRCREAGITQLFEKPLPRPALVEAVFAVAGLGVRARYS